MKKWKPSKAARREFAEKMQNPGYAEQYYARKKARADKRRGGSEFNYETAGGYYVPSQNQHYQALKLLKNNPTDQQREAAEIICVGYYNMDKVHNDYIHIINEWGRTNILNY